MSETKNQLDKKPLALESKASIESSSKNDKLYLKIDNYYLNDILKSRKNKKFEIPSFDSINEKLMNICPKILQKIFTLYLPNIGNLVNYRLIQKSNQYIFALSEETIFYKLTDITKNMEEPTKYEKEVEISQMLLDEFNNNFENKNYSPMENGLNEIIEYDDEEETKEKTQGTEIMIDEKKITDISFIQSIKFSSSKEYNDTLIFDIVKLKDSGILKLILELLSNNDYCKDNLFPIFFENDWYIPLPDWAYSIKSLDPFNLILTIILLIIILIISQATNINDISYICPIDDIYEQNNKKINELKEDPSIIERIFSRKNLNSISNEISNIYFESSYLTKKDNKNDSTEYFYNQLINLKNYIKKFGTVQEKLEKLFEKVSFYSVSNIYDSYHYSFSYFRKFLLNYSPFQYITDNLNEIYKKILNINDILKPYKVGCANEIKSFIPLKLSKKYNIDFIDYGSSAVDLEIYSSDRDILIYFEEKDKFNSISTEGFCIELSSELKKLPYLNIKIRYPKNIDVLLEIEYNINYNFIKECDKKINLKKVHIDITFTKDKKYVENIKGMINLIKSDLQKNAYLKPLVLILKTLLEREGYNKTHDGGLNSLSTFFLARPIAITYEKENPSLGKLFYLFLNKYSKYDFTYGIDENGKEFPFDQRYLQDFKKRIIIINPIIIKDIKYFTNTNDNIASGCFKPKKIIDFFKKLMKIYFGN